MDNVKIGDKVIAISVDDSIGDYEIGDTLTVVRQIPQSWSFIEGNEVEIAAFTTSMFAGENKKRFVLIQNELAEGIAVNVTINDGENDLSGIGKEIIDKFNAQKNGITFQGEPLGVARPVLETRKIGKDQMHMVNDGFPLALRHLAQIMTWAAEVKQYKLHDWRNLPNADVEFPSAEGRHANDNSIQKSMGLKALERVDHESGKLHIGHKVFNALCELELVLRGDIE